MEKSKHMNKQEKNRTQHPKKAEVMSNQNHVVSKSNNKERRSNSSPNTLVVGGQHDNTMISITQSNHTNLVNLRASDQGSNNASSTI